MATRVEQAQIGSGAIRDRPITAELETLLDRAAVNAGIDRVVVTSGGQPGTAGHRTGSTRHDGGRAADLHLVVAGKTLVFTDAVAPLGVTKFVTECARLGALGIGAGVAYMGQSTIHVGFGQTVDDRTHVVWGAEGKSIHAPRWLRDAATIGWSGPTTAPLPRPKPTAPPPPPPAPPGSAAGQATGGAGAAAGAGAIVSGIGSGNGWLIAGGLALVALGVVVFIISRRK